ncbi:ABC transporter ATP-binding protein [Mycobacterium sp. 236(2023)]|uniref:ABC transporter ATP-binding protein n=1 Tax=Mycobacterium sp. 236(2023) TaxID=3038163 RepID=UPI0024159633|nr:ABC transporter ATP-binding protein [Mycobacterium sp. 236(2023)]MDG4667625.1 ABC transporter ATP-binding protein [Mycobacterium sp. 236(2023)]
MTEQLLTVDRLTVTNNDGQDVVAGIGFGVAPGQTVGIVGESGSGKSVTCKTVLGILPQQLRVTHGDVTLAGHRVLDYGFREWRQLRGGVISAVFQDPGSYLNPSVPVGRQLATSLRVRYGLSRREAARRASDLFAELGLGPESGVESKLPRELSGGMLQRSVLAIALSGEPSLLIADEVTTALDVSVQAQVLDVLTRRQDATGMGIVFVSHDLAVVASVCDTVLVMRDGHIVEAGPTSSVLADPQHEYTRLLISEHKRFGIERFTASEDSRDYVTAQVTAQATA